MAPSHYQCWQTSDCWHPAQYDLTKNFQDILAKIIIQYIYLKIFIYLPGYNELNIACGIFPEKSYLFTRQTLDNKTQLAMHQTCWRLKKWKTLSAKAQPYLANTILLSSKKRKQKSSTLGQPELQQVIWYTMAWFPDWKNCHIWYSILSWKGNVSSNWL